MTTFVYSLSIVLMIVLPLGLAILLRRRFHVPWWLFLAGAATFVASQAVHLPVNDWLMDLGLLDRGMLTGTPLVRNALLLGLTAGLSEELARAAAFWLLGRVQAGRRWAEGVMLGLGHGGIEAMSFGAVLTAAALSSLLTLRDVPLETLNLGADQMLALEKQLELFTGSPLLGFAPLWERAVALTLHVALSAMVWAAFRRRNPFYLLLAIAYHMFFDAVAVYLSQQIDSVWLLELVLAAGVVPAAGWIWWTSRREQGDIRPKARIKNELSLFGTALHKELLQQWRTKRVLVVAAVFAIFGLMSPLIAHFTPEMLSMIEGAEQFADLVPEPTAADALGQYIKNITQFGFIIAVLLGMGAVAGEKERGMTAMVLSKPLPRWAFILSKFVAQALVYLLGFSLAFAGAYYYTLILFDGLAFWPFLLGNVLLLLWLLVFAAVTLLGSTLARSTGAAAAIGLGGAILLLLAGSLPTVGAFAPSALVSWAGGLGLAEVADNGGAVVANVVLIVVALLGAVAAFEVQEL